MTFETYTQLFYLSIDILPAQIRTRVFDRAFLTSAPIPSRLLDRCGGAFLGATWPVHGS